MYGRKRSDYFGPLQTSFRPLFPCFLSTLSVLGLGTFTSDPDVYPTPQTLTSFTVHQEFCSFGIITILLHFIPDNQLEKKSSLPQPAGLDKPCWFLPSSAAGSIACTHSSSRIPDRVIALCFLGQWIPLRHQLLVPTLKTQRTVGSRSWAPSPPPSSRGISLSFRSYCTCTIRLWGERA